MRTIFFPSAGVTARKLWREGAIIISPTGARKESAGNLPDA
jgi:hypothetical protein